VFDRDGCLKQDVDVTALFFLRQLLVIGKKLELGCSYDRIQAVVRNYHDIERQLRAPSLDWELDSLVPIPSTNNPGTGQTDTGLSVDHQYCYLSNSDGSSSDLLHGSSVNEELELDLEPRTGGDEGLRSVARRLHLVQALDGSFEQLSMSLPLFHEGKVLSEMDVERRKKDQGLLYKAQQVADLIIGSFDELDPLSFSAELEEFGRGIGFKHGPGAVAERLRQEEKSSFPYWPSKLQRKFPFIFCGKTAGDDRSHPIDHEVASRLIAVPKTTKGPRLIAAEPVAHQWCQQLVLKFLFDQCRKNFGSSFIDFKDQSKSGDLVLRASSDRALATVDLSDASDRLSCWTVERIFRSNPSILSHLHAARTRYLRDDISEIPSFLRLKKFASQGTAVTFPVMSLVMLCLALASTLEHEQVTWHTIRKYRNQVRVFGDDIILPTRGYASLVRLMEILQLKVNTAKSYVNGHFRESCGVDGYMGYDVTPVKPKTLVANDPASVQALIDNSNNLFLKGLWNASQACYDLLPARLRRGIRIVGVTDAGQRGLASYSGSDESHLAKRWNSRFHRYEVRVWTLSIRTQERPRNGFSALLDFFASKHNHEHARIVSEYADVRKTKLGLQWEPSCTAPRKDAGSPCHGAYGS
jgi:hypothetical protein